MQNTVRQIAALTLAGTLAVSGVTACTPLTQPDGSRATGAPATSATSATSSLLGSRLLWADGSVISVNPRKLDQAQNATPGIDYTEYFSTRELQERQKAFMSLGVDASGALAGVMGTLLSSQDRAETGELMDAKSLRVGRYTAKSFLPFADAANGRVEYRPQALSGGLVNDEGIIWGEHTEDSEGNRGWKILGVSPGSTHVRVLASKTHTPAPDSTFDLESLQVTALVDDRVYWHTAKQSSATDYPAYQMMSVGFTNPDEPRVEAQDTERSFRWKQGVLATNLKPNDDGSPVAQAITSYAPGAEPQEILRLEKLQSDGQGLELLGADDRGITVFYDGDLFLIDPETHSTEMFRGPYQSGISGFTQCGSKLSWSYWENAVGSNTERYVFDRESAQLQVFHDAPTLGTGSCSVDFMSWAEHRPSAGDLAQWDVVTRREH